MKKFDDVQTRIKQYERAKNERLEKLNLLEQSYRFALPGRNKWIIKTPSYDKTTLRWDDTAVEALQSFTNNIQSLLMPQSQKWMNLISPKDLSDSEQKVINGGLQKFTDRLFQYINKSDLYLQSNISFQDMGISVGMLQIIPQDNTSAPFRFESVPMETVALESVRGKIENVFRDITIQAKYINTYWPKAKLTKSIMDALKYNPDNKIKLIESTIYYPNNPPSSRYLYTVTDISTQEDLIFEPMEISYWIPFRFSVSPGEDWGFGPVMQSLDFIRIANMIAEFDLQNAGYQVAKPLLIKASAILNNYTLKMRPGAEIRVTDLSQPPIQPLNIAGELKLDQVELATVQQKIREFLFADPLGSPNDPSKTATEISLRQQNWVKKSAASFNRLSSEFLHPVIEKSLFILKKKGIFNSFNIGNSTIDFDLGNEKIEVDFRSPLQDIEDQEEIQKITQFYASLGQIAGPQATIAATNIDLLPQLLAEKYNIPLSLVKNSSEIKQIIQQLMGAQQQSQQQAQQPQGQPQIDSSGQGSSGVQTQVPDFDLTQASNG